MKEEVEKVKGEEGRGEDPSFCCCSSLFRILIRHVTLSSIVANDDDSDNGEDDDVDNESEGQEQGKSQERLIVPKTPSPRSF